jgi:hypothetical protein
MEPDWTTVGTFWATIIVCLVTIAATVINYYLFRSQTDPEVIVYTKHDLKHPTIITLVVENIGKSVAYDVQFNFSDKIPAEAYGFQAIPKDKIKWMTSGPLVNGIPALPPGGIRELYWGQYYGLKSVIGVHAITVTASYKARKPFSPELICCETESKIDIESYADTVANSTDELGDIREELKNINQTLKLLSSKISD